MIDLFSYLSEYKSLTEEILNSIEKDDYDNLSNLFDKRQEVINTLENNKYDLEEFKEIIKNSQILLLQEKLDSIMQQKRKELLDKMNGIAKNKLANQNYYKKNYEDSILLNKKI